MRAAMAACRRLFALESWNHELYEGLATLDLFLGPMRSWSIWPGRRPDARLDI